MSTKKESPAKLADEKQVKSKTKSIEAKAPKIERLIYIGPNINKIGLQKYSVFKGKIPQNVDDLIKEIPATKRLIVSVEKFSVANTAVEMKGTAENHAYQLVKEYLKGSDR